MSKIFTDGKGHNSKYPITYKSAVEHNSKFYNDNVKCKKCKSMSTKYTYDHKCRFCFRIESGNFYNLFKDNGMVITDENGRHIAKLAFGVKQEIDDDTMQEMKLLVEIARNDDTITVSPEPCKQKTHYGIKINGKCYQCKQERAQPTPRQKAIRNSAMWYTPEINCGYCGVKAPKRVSTGACSNCLGVNTNDEPKLTPEQQMMLDNPDMVLSKSDAKLYGLKVYRTGNECKNGHKAFRYVTTSNCIDCIKMG